MDRLEEILKNNQKILDLLVRLYGPLSSHISIDQNDNQSNNEICSKNKLRRRGLCFISKGPWALNHSCPGDKKKATKTKEEDITSHHGEYFVDGSIDLQDGEQHHDIIQGGLQDDKYLEVYEGILPNDINEVDSYTMEFVDSQVNIHKEYEQSSIHKIPPMYLCSTVERDEHIVSTDEGDIGYLSEDPTIVN